MEKNNPSSFEKNLSHFLVQFKNKDLEGRYITDNLIRRFRARIQEVLKYHHQEVDKNTTVFFDEKKESMPEEGDIIRERLRKIKKIQETLEHFMNQILENIEKEEDQIKIFNALVLAIKVHIDENDRLEGQPVIGHVIEVAQKMMQDYEILDKDLIISGILHDSIEDNALYLAYKKNYILRKGKRENQLENAALDFIEDLFGPSVADTISFVSKPDFEKMIEDQKSLGRKKSKSEIKNELYEVYIKEILKDPKALIIKYMDFEVNALEMLERQMPEGAKKIKQMKKYYGVLDVFEEAINKISQDHPFYKYKNQIIEKIKKTRKDYERYFKETEKRD